MTEVLPPADAQAEVAFSVEQNIRGIIKEMRKGWILLARELYRFHDLKMWEALGYPSFDAWLAGPDIDLRRRHVYGLIEVWRELVIDRQVEPLALEGVPISKIRDALPAIRRGQISVDRALSDAVTLSRSDMRERYDQAPALGDWEPGLEATEEQAWAICPTCGSRYRVQG